MKRFQLSSFQAIIFDLDSTLTDTNSYPIRASEWLLAQSTSNPSEMLQPYIMELVGFYRDELKQIVNGGPYRPPIDVIRSSLKKTVKSLSLPIDDTLLEQGAQVFSRMHIEMSDLMPGAIDLLTTLKELGIKMGVITNAFEGHADTILEELEIADFFEAVIDGSDVKAYKPMREPFEFTVNALGAELSKSLMIGDEFANDIVGAKALGMSAVWVNVRKRSLDDLLEKYGLENTPDLVVDSLAELQTFI